MPPLIANILKKQLEPLVGEIKGQQTHVEPACCCIVIIKSHELNTMMMILAAHLRIKGLRFNPICLFDVDKSSLFKRMLKPLSGRHYVV